MSYRVLSCVLALSLSACCTAPDDYPWPEDRKAREAQETIDKIFGILTFPAAILGGCGCDDEPTYDEREGMPWWHPQ